MTTREKHRKGAAAAMARRKAIVTGFTFDGKPVVQIRVHDGRDGKASRETFADMTPDQTRNLIRLLVDCLNAAEQAAPGRDRTSI